MVLLYIRRREARRDGRAPTDYTVLDRFLLTDSDSLIGRRATILKRRRRLKIEIAAAAESKTEHGAVGKRVELQRKVRSVAEPPIPFVDEADCRLCFSVHYRVSHKNDPLCCFAKISIFSGTFFSQILHTHVLNKDIHVDHFWCLISKYTECDNIFIN